MNRKILVLGVALTAAPLLTSAVMSQTTAPADAVTTAPATDASQPAASSQPAPKDLADTLQKGVDLLTAGKVKETIQLLAPPDDLAKQEGGIDKIVSDFTTSGMDKKLLAALKAAQGQSPTVSSDGKSASYAPMDTSTPPLEFTKVNDTWYLK